MRTVENILEVVVHYAWGPPVLILLLGGGAVLLAYSRFLPFLGLKHVKNILAGKYDHEDDPGEISHFQAVSTALASTVGMGNIGGVAIAITQGGPGALFWMWMAAIVGMATKFFTCSLAVMYRGKDSMGQVQGGPMYYIETGLGPKFKPFAVFFSLCGTIGCLSIFQSNQMAEILKATYEVPPAYTGLGSILVVSIVILGGVQRIARVASGLVPTMCLIYLVAAVYIVTANYEAIPGIFRQIINDAFTGTAALGGAAGIGVITVIQTGVKRAAFSNEAGVGSAAIAHSAVKTNEPLTEGYVALLEPFIDTVVICTMTALVIVITGTYGTEGLSGVALTSSAFQSVFPWFGVVLAIAVLLFAFSTMISWSYYGLKSWTYLFGEGKTSELIFKIIFCVFVVIGCSMNLGPVIDFSDAAIFAMSIFNVIGLYMLMGSLRADLRDYQARLASGEIKRYK